MDPLLRLRKEKLFGFPATRLRLSMEPANGVAGRIASRRLLLMRLLWRLRTQVIVEISAVRTIPTTMNVPMTALWLPKNEFCDKLLVLFAISGFAIT